MTISRPIALVLLCAVAASAGFGVTGCAGVDDGAGGSSGGGAAGAGGFGGVGGAGGADANTRLDLESDASVALMPMEGAQIVVRYLDDNDQPITRTAVTFTLIGSVRDSGLSRLNVTTDSAGRAKTTLIAGQQAASFRVRVSAVGAAPLVIDVAVSDRGFGNLRVEAAYEGARLVTQRRIALFAARTCEDVVDAGAADRQSNLTMQGDSARFIGLPAETSYAVLALAIGDSASPLAQGCVDGVEIVADVETSVTVTFHDFDLNPWGDYALSVSLATDEIALELADRVRDYEMAATPIVELTTAQSLLTALDEALRADENALPNVEAADALALLRDPGSADVDLQTALDDATLGPLAVQVWLAEQLEQELAVTDLSLDLTLDEGTAEPSIAWTLRSARTPSQLTDEGRIERLAEEPMAVAATLSFEWAEDRMTATGGMPAMFGALSVEVIDAVIDGGDQLGRAHARELLGCTALNDWVQAQASVADACDAACVAAVCDRVLSTLLLELQNTLVTVDVARPLVTLDATFDLSDTAGDGNVNTLLAEQCTASWSADATVEGALASVMTGSAHAERIPTATP